MPGDKSPSTSEPAVTMATPVVPPAIVLTREIKIRKFFGTEEEYAAEEFEEEMRRGWATQPGLSNWRKLDLILAHVGPVVRAELRCQEDSVQSDPEKALQALVTIFGEKRRDC